MIAKKILTLKAIVSFDDDDDDELESLEGLEEDEDLTLLSKKILEVSKIKKGWK